MMIKAYIILGVAGAYLMPVGGLLALAWRDYHDLYIACSLGCIVLLLVWGLVALARRDYLAFKQRQRSIERCAKKSLIVLGGSHGEDE